MTKTIHHNPQAAGLYRAIALRWHARYVEARDSVKMRGGDVPDHGALSTTQADADQGYAAALGGCLFETPDSAEAVLALVHFAGILAVDRLVGEITQEPVNDERDAYHQTVAIAAVARWLNNRVIGEYMDREREARS